MLRNMDIKLATLALSALFFLPQLATAGPLAQSAHAIDNKSSSPSSSSSSSSDDHDTSSSSDAGDNYSSSGTSHLRTHSSLCDDGACTTRESRPLRIPAPDLELGLAAQKVRGSDGSLRIAASMLFGRLGLFASGDYYFEEISQAGDPKTMRKARSEHVRVNLFELALLGRVIDARRFQMDLHAGLGIATSSLFETLPGTTVGVSLQARASEATTLRVEGRAMALRRDTRALEGAAGVQWRTLWFGYRALQFDVGQILQGPEAGVRLTF